MEDELQIESKAEEEKKELTLEEIFKFFYNTYSDKDPSDEARDSFARILSDYLKQEVKKFKCAEENNLLIHFDNTIIVKGDSDKIYTAVGNFPDKTKPLMLILVSNGGEPGSAYLIGKLCREFCNGKFVVAVPRHAKSAATLLACAADEIHMGSLSELGPIDPQINRMPTLGLKNSIEHIADLVSKAPGSSEMFARYLQRTIEPVQIGYYERVAESSVQYAEKLLDKHSKTLAGQIGEIAQKLVYGYKDHGFVIDKEEATNIFGDQTIKSNTNEYDLSNIIYNVLSGLESIASILGYNFYFIGSIDSKPSLIKKTKK